MPNVLVLCRSSKPLSPCAGTEGQHTCKHSDLARARRVRVLWIKSCGDDDFHHNINQTKGSGSENSRSATSFPMHLRKDN